jgi:hypothetical protein
VRREYWSHQCGDLEIIEEKLGPALFFITLSSAKNIVIVMGKNAIIFGKN